MGIDKKEYTKSEFEEYLKKIALNNDSREDKYIDNSGL